MRIPAARGEACVPRTGRCPYKVLVRIGAICTETARTGSYPYGVPVRSPSPVRAYGALTTNLHAGRPAEGHPGHLTPAGGMLNAATGPMLATFRMVTDGDCKVDMVRANTRRSAWLRDTGGLSAEEARSGRSGAPGCSCLRLSKRASKRTVRRHEILTWPAGHSRAQQLHEGPWRQGVDHERREPPRRDP
jgi:hypothetical protein